MNPSNHEGIEKLTETTRRYEAMRSDVMEMHLADRNTGTEVVFCGGDASDDERMGVDYYLEQRKDGFGVGNVCEPCKAFAPPFALRLGRDLEAEGMPDDAEEYRRLAETLARETGQNPPGG